MPSHSYKGSYVSNPPAAPLNAPVLSAPDSSTLTWSWGFADPDSWNIEQSADGGTTWDVIDNVTGSAREYDSPNAGQLARIIGLSSLMVPVTAYSNVVTVPT